MLKKILSITFIFVLSIFLSTTAIAGENTGLVGGGVAYTTFGEDFGDWDGLESAFGFYLEGQTPIDENIEIGGRYSRFSTEDSHTETVVGVEWHDELNITLTGIEANAVYNLNPNDEFNLRLIGGIGRYSAEIDVTEQEDGVTVFEGTEFDESGFGVRVGAGIDQEFTQDISFTGNAAYRILDLEDDIGEIDFSGVELSGGIIFSF